MIKRITYLLLVINVVILTGCSVSRNTWLSRTYHSMTTDYNVFFNGNQNFNRALRQSEEKNKDDFSHFLPIHISNTYTSASEASGFKTTVEKSQKAIKFHSIKAPPTRGRFSVKKYRDEVGIEEFNPVIHKSWLQMGMAHYYSGDFMTAATTFQYIMQHFRNLPKTVMQSRLWLVMCYLNMNWYYEAETLYEKTERHNIPLSLHPLLARVDLEFALKNKQYAKAETLLPVVIDATSNRYQKERLYFLQAQVQAENGNRDAAYASLSKVLRMNPPYELGFNAQIRQAEFLPLSQTDKAKKTLLGMAKLAKNKDYLDRIYYAVGNIHMANGDSLGAIENYKMAVEKDTRKGKEMLSLNMMLADMLFDRRRYSEAQPYFANAVELIDKKHNDYRRIQSLSEVLDELVVQEQNVATQDSLLRVAALPESEKMEVIKGVILRLIEQEKKAAEDEARQLDEQRRADLDAEREAAMPSFAQQRPVVNTDNSWYFYNNPSVVAGKQEFLRKWGNRKLEDNWRRRNKSELVFGQQGGTTTPTEEDEQAAASGLTEEAASTEKAQDAEAANDPKRPEYYLAQLPSTPKQVKASEDIVAAGLFNMGMVFKDKLEDYPLAIENFNLLLARFPASEYTLSANYSLYIIALKQSDAPLAEQAKGAILRYFPTSQEAKVVSNPNFVANYVNDLRMQDSIYQEAYVAYQRGEHSKVVALSKSALDYYPLSELTPNYLYLQALSSIALGDKETFDVLLKQLIEQYPQAPLSKIAGEVVKGVIEGKIVQNSSALMASTVWDRPITFVATTDAQLEFKNDPLTPHFVFFAFPSEGIDKNQLMYDVAAFHFRNFKIKDFDMEFLNFEGVSMLKISPFLSFEELMVYKRFMYSPKGMNEKMPTVVLPILISQANFDILLKSGKTFKEYDRYYIEQLEPRNQTATK